MKEFAHYNKQFNRALEEVFTDSEKNSSVKENLTRIFCLHETKFSRVVATLNLLKTFLPDIKYNYKTENLPFDPNVYDFQEGVIGNGGENDVYLLDSRDKDTPSLVLKFDHQDCGDIPDLARRAKEIRSEYERVKTWFQDIPELIAEEYSVIMEHPRNGRPTITTLQKYYGRQPKDLFDMIEQDNWPDYIATQPRLQQDIATFITINEKQDRESSEMLDLLGKRNISVIESDRESRLLVLDPHLISHPDREKKDIIKRQRQKLARLQELMATGKSKTAEAA